MPIQVICPSCHARFKVSDQFAGKTGPCPKCKGQIQIPAADEQVVIHEPELEAGAKDAKGRNVLKPIKRKETKFRLNAALIIGGGALLTFAIAYILGAQKLESGPLTAVLIGGALLLGPLLAYAGYTFLRNDEQGAFVGKELLLRSLACGAVYALIWGIYWFVGFRFFGDDYDSNQLELFNVGVLALLALGLGTFTAFVSFDFEPLVGFFHYALYFGLSVLLRATMGLTLLPGIGGGSPAPQPKTPAKSTAPVRLGQNETNNSVPNVLEARSNGIIDVLPVTWSELSREFAPRDT